MTKLLLLFCLLFGSAFAEEFFPVPAVKFQITSNNPIDKLTASLKYPEDLLRRYKPEGAKISNKRVSNNHISFNATKTYMLISKTVGIHGTFDANENDVGCAHNEVGFDLVFVFDGSDQLVSDNIDRLEAKLCAKEQTKTLAMAVVRTKIFKGRNYSNALGPVVKGIIEAQINPLLRALNEELQSSK